MSSAASVSSSLAAAAAGVQPPDILAAGSAPLARRSRSARARAVRAVPRHPRDRAVERRRCSGVLRGTGVGAGLEQEDEGVHMPAIGRAMDGEEACRSGLVHGEGRR